MSALISLSDRDLDTVSGGCHRSHHAHHNACGNHRNGNGGMNQLQRFLSAANISIIVIANSTINGNLTINLAQGISR